MGRIGMIVSQTIAGAALGYILSASLAYMAGGVDVIWWTSNAIFTAFGVWGVGALANSDARRWSRFLWTLAAASVMAVLASLSYYDFAYAVQPDFGYVLLASLVGYWASRA